VTKETIVVDSSAIIAILLQENEARDLLQCLNLSMKSICSAMTFLECVMVLSTRAPQLPLPRFEEALADFGIDLVPVGADHGRLAAEAFVRFGKGRHPAELNMGDCFSYALAKSLHAPLLYKGEDFAKTDIASAMAPGVKP
jgi:ribonuclease VapC